MQEALIYGGIGINVAGALYLMAYAFKYSCLFRQAREQDVRNDALKAAWGRKRMIGFGLIIAGTIIAVAGCALG